MGAACRLRFSDHQRPFWLLVALAVMLLITVSTGIARGGPTEQLLIGLARDLGALRAQLEAARVEPAAPASERLAFNADIASGDAGFHTRAVSTVLRSAKRRAGRLARAMEQADAPDQTELAALINVRLHDLERTLDRLGAPETGATGKAIRADAVPILDRLEELISALRAERARDRSDGAVAANGGEAGPALPAIIRGTHGDG